jgi:hypothetical protein
MKRIMIQMFIIAILLNGPAIFSQSKDEKSVREVIDKLFDGMRLADSSAVSGLFHPDVRMMTSYENESGEAVLKEGSLEGFLQAIGTPHPEIWNEKIWDTEVRIDDNLAQVWTDYAFFVGEQFSHCGIDAFQLVRGDDGIWRIINLIDTRRKKPCDLP